MRVLIFSIYSTFMLHVVQMMKVGVLIHLLLMKVSQQRFYTNLCEINNWKPCSSCITDNVDDSLDDLLGDLEHKQKTMKKTERPRSSSPAVPQKTETGESGDVSHIWASHDWLWPLTSLSVPQRLQQLPWGRGTIWRLMMKMIWWTLWASEKQTKHMEMDWHWKKRGNVWILWVFPPEVWM